MPSRLFTLEEAILLLPVVGRLVTEIQAAKAAVAEASARLESLLERTGGNGHLAGQIEGARAAVETSISDMQALIGELEEMGVELKDVELGLADFRSMRDGRVVYLCWRQGEETIAFWHELDTGFAGREPL